MIEHTVVKVNSVVRKNSTKNNSSRRAYPITEDIRKILELLKKQQEKNRTVFGDTYVSSDYVLTWEDGRPYSPDYISHAFKRFLEQNELPPIRFHELRHSCASIMLTNGCNLKDVQAWLGHSDIKMTANIYGHLDMDRKQEVASSMNNIFAG